MFDFRSPDERKPDCVRLSTIVQSVESNEKESKTWNDVDWRGNQVAKVLVDERRKANNNNNKTSRRVLAGCDVA